MAFIISGAAAALSSAAFVAAGGVAAGTAAVTAATAGSVIGGGLAAGALGAGLGAGTAALTGGDVGKGALMGGVGGVVTGGLASGLGAAGGAAASGTGASTAIGAGAGAAGGAAGAAAGGEDPLTGALYGGALGGVGGYMKGSDGIAGASDIPVGDSGSLPSPKLNMPAATDPGGITVGNQGITAGNPLNITTASPQSVASNSMQPGNYLQKGIGLIKQHPGEAMQVAGLGLGMLGSPQQQQAQQAQTINTTDYLSPDFQRYQATPNYAEGGAVQAPQGPMNPIVARAMAEQQAKMQQQSAQPQQPQVQQPQVQPTQTIQAQPQMQAMPIQQAPMREMAPMDSPRIKEMLAQQNQVQQQLQQNPMREMASMGSPRVKEMLAQQNQVQQKLQQTPMREMGMAGGGIVDGYSLGGYAHGGNPRLLKGPGSGISDDIPATIGHDGKQPARLATGEFVVPARIVSELGSGDTDAGGKVLQEMVDRIQSRRAKTVGKGKVAADSKAHKSLPA